MRYLLGLAGLALVAACGTVNANERSEGPQTSRSFAVTGFDRVALRGPDNVEVRVGPAESVSVTGPAAILDQLEVDVKDGVLRLGRKRGIGRGSWTNGSAVFTVTVPRLNGAAVAGSGDMRVDRADSPRFAASVAGSGNLTVDQVATDALDLNIAGSGDLAVGGRAETLAASIAGSGDVDAARLRSQRANISVAGSGNVRAGVDKDADISIIGSGDVEILGNAKCRVSKMGSGSVVCAG